MTPTSKMKNIDQIALFSVVLSIAVFSLLFVLFDFTFLADDYLSLARSATPASFSIDVLRPYVTRFPITALVTWGLFRSGIFERTWLPMIGFFSVYAVAMSLLLRYLIFSSDLKDSLESCLQARKRYFGMSVKTLAVLLFTSLILFPTHYEVWYWPSNMAVSLGALFLGVALLTKSNAMKLLLLTSTFFVSESFVVPSLCFLTFPSFYRVLNKKKAKLSSFLDVSILKSLGLGIASVLAYLSLRLALSLWFPSHQYGLSWDFVSILYQMTGGLLRLFSLHFYKVLWGPTLGFWLILAVFLWHAVKLKVCSPFMWLVLILYVVASVVPYGLLTYCATRALFGAQLLVVSLMGWTFLNVLAKGFGRRVVLLTVGLLILFLGHQQLILNTKTSNFRVLRGTEQALTRQMAQCVAPCRIVLENLDAGLERDWVLPPDYWGGFARWIKAKQFPDKEIEFIDR